VTQSLKQVRRRSTQLSELAKCRSINGSVTTNAGLSHGRARPSSRSITPTR